MKIQNQDFTSDFDQVYNSAHMNSEAIYAPVAPRIRQPANAFLRYKRDYAHTVKRDDSISLSKILADMWRNESAEIKSKYQQEAQRARESSGYVSNGRRRRRSREQDLNWSKMVGYADSVLYVPTETRRFLDSDKSLIGKVLSSKVTIPDVSVLSQVSQEQEPKIIFGMRCLN